MLQDTLEAVAGVKQTTLTHEAHAEEGKAAEKEIKTCVKVCGLLSAVPGIFRLRHGADNGVPHTLEFGIGP